MKKISLYIIFLFHFFTLGPVAQESEWRIFGEMKYPVSGAQTVVKDSLVYLIGGYSDSLQTNVKWIQKFNPNDNSWEIVANLDERRYGFSAEIHYDKLYIFGGINELNDKSLNLEVWDFESELTSVGKVDDTFDRVFPVGTIYKDIYYIIGGFAGSRGSSAELPYFVGYNFNSSNVSIFDDTTFQSNELPIQQMSVRMENKLYVFGGAYNGILQNMDVIDLDSASLTTNEHTRFITPRAAGSAVYFNDYNQIYLIGGYTETSPAISSVEVITNVDGQPQTYMGTNINYARRNLSAVYFEGKIYVLGGENANGEVVPQIEVLDSGLVDVREEENLNKEFVLHQNYPNPFNPETVIEFSVDQSRQISIDVFNSLGQRITTLYKKYTIPGSYSVKWNGRDESGKTVSSGIYFYRLSDDRQNYLTRKMILLK